MGIYPLKGVEARGGPPRGLYGPFGFFEGHFSAPEMAIFGVEPRQLRQLGLAGAETAISHFTLLIANC